MADLTPNKRPDGQSPEDGGLEKVWNRFRSTSCLRPSRTILRASTR